MRNIYSPKDIVSSGLCIGCGSCVANSGLKMGMLFDAYGQLKPQMPRELFTRRSEIFSKTCPFSPAAENEDFLSADLFPDNNHCSLSIGRHKRSLLGHVAEEDFRIKGSSGGMVSWVASELMKKGLIDGFAHVIETEEPHSEGRFFKYRISRNEKEIREGSKSRYYPVEFSEVLKTIAEVPGRYAIVAVPCMIKAVQLLRSQNPVFHERICFTLGLFCGHMKSARFVESFAWQMNVPLAEVKQVDFRHKQKGRPANWYNALLSLRDGKSVNRDWWDLADGDWGAGFFMNSACNLCDDVVAETADISFGDAWVEPYASDGNGTNVVIVRSELIDNLIAEGIKEKRLLIKEVTGRLVERTQAAGLRHRREGLTYRLKWAPRNVQQSKRVAPYPWRVPRKRRKIYLMRYIIAKWSHRVFWVARKTHMPSIYLTWARISTAVYHGIVYHNGNTKEMKKRYSQLKNSFTS